MKIRILLSKVVSAAKSGVALVVVTAIGLTAFGGATPGRGTDAYVRRGLLAIWDGIENTGSTRQHDANITVWKDVVGDRAFALTGVTITEDGLVFDGSGASSRGVLSAEDAAAMFGLAGNGTMEIVLEPDEESKTNQRLALQGPKSNDAGLSIGYGLDGRIYFQNLILSYGINYDWRGEANTFSVWYSNSRAVTDGSGVFRNGELLPKGLYISVASDYWGSPDSNAYVGGRASGADGFVGKICCIRLYDRHLSADEVAANAEVDRIRYCEKPSANQLVIAGDPANYGNPTPAYGTMTTVSGEAVELNVEETDIEDGTARIKCVGHRILRMNVSGGREQEGEDSDETSFSYQHDGAVARKIEWLWHVSDLPGVAAPQLVSARRHSAEFGIRVAGAGYDGYGARLSLAWGVSAQQLNQTNAVATVFGPCDCRAHLTRVKSVDYYVRSVLEKLDADGNAVSAFTSDIVSLPADRIDDERTCEYVKDGLVAWWDGIYNGGSDKTFGNAPSVWRDVVGDVCFTVNGYAPSVTRDSMVFSGVPGVNGVLSEFDTAQTFGKCSGGTLEVVVRGNRQDYACIAVRGSDASGIAFGPSYSNGSLKFILTSGDVTSTLPGHWANRRTFAVRYGGAVPQDAVVDGVPAVLSSALRDNWGNGGDAVRAYIGNRASNNAAFDGEICAIRLYNRRLTDEEAAANSRVDDNRFRGRLHNCLEITGITCEYGLVTPYYGYYYDLAPGAQIVCTAPATAREGDMLATCAGWVLQTNAVGDTSVWLPWRSGEGTECTYEHKKGITSRLVWQWELTGGGAMDLGSVGSENIRSDSLDVRVQVLSIGDADSATLTLKWGCSPTALANETSRTVTGMGESVFALEGLLPGRRYVVQATLTGEGSDPVASAVVGCDTLAGEDPEGTRERTLAAGLAYVSSVVADGLPGDGVTVTGKVEFPVLANDCGWSLLVWEVGSSDVMRLSTDEVTVDEEGNFSLTVVTDDPDADGYIHPGRRYELSVVTDLGDGAVSASSAVAFEAASESRIDGNSVSVVSDQRTLKVIGRLLSVGAGGVTTLTLMAGETAESMRELNEVSVHAPELAFSLSGVLPEVERTYAWAIRCSNETDGKTVCWTNVQISGSISVHDAAHYIWSGASGSGRWCDRGNWLAQRRSTDPTPLAPEDCVGYPNGVQASAQFMPETTATVEVDRDVTCGVLSMNDVGVNVTMTSESGRKLAVQNLRLFSGGKALDPTVKVFDGVKMSAPASKVIVGNGSRVILRNGAELECKDYCMAFDGSVFNGCVGTNLTVVGTGCKLKVEALAQLASETTCVVSNGTLEVGGNLVFNCETDGGTLRIEGDHPLVRVAKDVRSTNEPRMLTGSGGIVFDIPEGGYQSVPIVLQSATSSFGGTDAQACVPLHLNVDWKSRAYRNQKATVYPLLSTAGSINTTRQAFGELRRPQVSAFVYAEAADKPVWQSRDDLLPTAAPKLFGVRLGGAGGLVIFFQ